MKIIEMKCIKKLKGNDDSRVHIKLIGFNKKSANWLNLSETKIKAEEERY